MAGSGRRRPRPLQTLLEVKGKGSPPRKGEERMSHTPSQLAQAILDALERNYIPPYGDDEQWMVQQMIEHFLKERESKRGRTVSPRKVRKSA